MLAVLVSDEGDGVDEAARAADDDFLVVAGQGHRVHLRTVELELGAECLPRSASADVHDKPSF